MTMDTDKEIKNMLQKLVEINTKLDAVLGRLDDHETRLRALESVPARRWEVLVGEIISIVAALAIGLLVGKII